MKMEKLEIEKLTRTASEKMIKLESLTRTAYERFKSAGTKCSTPASYHGLVEWMNFGKKGLLSIQNKGDKGFEYAYHDVPKVYIKRIEKIMKELGVEHYIYSPADKCP